MVTQVGDTEQPPQGESGAEEPELLLRPHLPCPSILLLNQIWSEWNQLYRCAVSEEEEGGDSWDYLKILPTTSISTSKREEVQGNVFVSHKFLTRKRRRPYSCLTPWCAAREDFLVIQTFQDRHSWGLQQGLEPPLFSGKKNQTFWKDNTWTISTVAKNTWVIILFFLFFSHWDDLASSSQRRDSRQVGRSILTFISSAV